LTEALDRVLGAFCRTGLDAHPRLSLGDELAQLGEDELGGRAATVQRLDPLQPPQHRPRLVHLTNVAWCCPRRRVSFVPSSYTRAMIVCSNCGEENPERARFCLACGTALEPAPSGEERKVVSVLFVDLVGFTAGADRADPEDVRATLRPYHERVSREIERFGGTVEKFVGDAVMAVFGAPLAHEDDAERAVRAGLRIINAIEDLNEHEGLELAVRAAVATGEAVVQLGAQPGTGEGIATGDVVNTAARLQGAAPVGGLVVNEQAYRATRHAITYEELPALELKGKGDPVPTWRALAAMSRFGVDADAAPATPFVGRDRELRLLHDTFERMVGESEIQLVTITGEPGVGKTRLLGEFRAWVDDRPELVYWRQGRCLPYGDGITFWALGEIVKAHAGILESDAPDEAASKLNQAVAEADDAEWLLARLGPLVGLAGGGETDREESYRAWQRFIESLAARGPLVLLFEDLHWADNALLEFIERLVDWSSGLPILVLCTGRPELYESHPAWGGGKRNSTTVALSPLSQEETARLVAALLDAAVLPAETQAALLDRAGGNPLYAEEYARLFLELGSAENLPLPDTVQGLIAARLDTLPPQRKSLLQDAAVIGKVFWAGALEAMGERDGEAVRDGLHQLARKELLRPARLTSVEGQAEYAFWHALIRDVAYGQIPRSARATKHLAVADWIEEMAGARLVDHSELLAHHTTEAIALGQAAGGSAGPELELRAARYLVLAGDRAIELDVGAAAARYRQALELLPAGSEEHGLTLLKLAETAQVEGAFEQARDHAEAAASELEAIAAARSAARAYSLVGNVYFQLGGADRMRGALERSLALLEPLAPGPELIETYARMASLESMSGGSPQLGLDWAEKAVSLGEELRLPRELSRAYQWRGLMRCELGDLAGIEDLERGLAMALEFRQVGVIPAYVNLADQVWRQRGPAAALEIQTTAIEFAERRGGTPTWPRAESCWMLYDLGRWDELLQVANGIRRFEETHGPAQPGAMAQGYAAFVLIRRGAIDEGATVAANVLAHARLIEDPQVLGPALVASALVAEATGNSSSAVSDVEEYRHVTRNRPYFRAQNLTDAARVACAAGDIALAEGLLDNVVTAAERDRLSALTVRAMISEDRGAYTEAAAGWKALGCVFEHALALRGAGEETEAASILAELGVPPAAAQTAARTAK
jgi:class 3 adenylate cyclase